MARYPSAIRLVFRHYPLAIHDSAVAAARVSECASQQGQFDRVHHVLFAYASLIGERPWSWFGQKAELRDQAAFNDCVGSQNDFSAIARDRAAGDRLGVIGTPTFLINDLEVTGAPSLDQLDKYVREALKRSTK
jgi:protein-disulfide isomerase